jgi:predicted dehydrogenase
LKKVCLIGVSSYGAVHYNMLMKQHEKGRISIVAVTIINQEEEKEKCSALRSLGCKIYDDYIKMLSDNKDIAEICTIPTGTPFHKVMTIAALEAGMHVLVEKPLAGCIEDVEAMKISAKINNKVVGVGYQHLYSNITQNAKKALLENKIGKIKEIKCLVLWPRSHAYYQRNSWAGKLEINGTSVNDSPFNNAVAHELMMMLYLAGLTHCSTAKVINTHSNIYRANAIDSCDTASIKINTKEEIDIYFYATHATKELYGPVTEVIGENGQITITHKKMKCEITGGGIIEEELNSANSEQDIMLSAFIDHIEGKDAFICDMDLAGEQTLVISQIHKEQKIQDVSGKNFSNKKGETATAIPNIEKRMREAYANNKMLIL